MKQFFTSVYITAIFFFACMGMAHAQTSKITGTVKDAAAKPVEFATVSLLRSTDSVIIKGTLSDEKGTYLFDNVAKGSYLIKTTSVGYVTGLSKAFASDGSSEVSVPLITMTETARSLNAVNVTAAKPLIERKVDRTVMNVENSILAAGNTAMEILERAPGVTVDKDDNISLRGKQGVTVMINDKLTYLSAAQLATLLRSTDGNTISTIEIITNPSAKYDAAGNSGIINIKLKKNKQKGTNGSLSAGVSRGRGNRDATSLNINHKNGPLNIFGTISRGDNNRYREMTINRVVANPDTPFFDQSTKMPSFNYYNNFNIGADLETSANHTIGIVASGYTNGGHDINDNLTERRSPQRTMLSYLTTGSNLNGRYKNLAFNVNDRLKLDTLGQELALDIDYSNFSNNSIAEYKTWYFNPNGSLDPAKTNPEILRNQSPSTIKIYSGKADYTKPLSKTWKLETGLKYSSVKTDNDLQAQKLEGGNFINDAQRTNRFVYTEQIAAAYTNINHQFKNGSIQVGLRAENTESDGDLVSTNKRIKRSYLNFFPSVFINRSFGKKNDLGFSYSRRIDRPNYSDLNPFEYLLDRFTFMRGNSFLKPQYTNNFEFTYTYDKTVNVSLNYSLTNDVITQLILTEGNLTYQTNENLRTQESYGITIYSPYTITKWWTGNANFNGFYLGFKATGLVGGNVDNGQRAFTFRSTQNFTIAKFKAEVTGNYRSALTYGIFHLQPQYSIDAGLGRAFANKKLNVKVSLSDIFNTLRNDLTSNELGNNFQIKQKSDTRVFRVNLTYNFGSTNIKARQHRSGAEAEKGRVSSGN